MPETERDLVLPFNTFAFIVDETKGVIECHVGPTKTSLAKESRPSIFDPKSKMFKAVPLEQAIQTITIAPEALEILRNGTKPVIKEVPTAVEA